VVAEALHWDGAGVFERPIVTRARWRIWRSGRGGAIAWHAWGHRLAARESRRIDQGWSLERFGELMFVE
jgi:hypothetical protein